MAAEGDGAPESKSSVIQEEDCDLRVITVIEKRKRVEEEARVGHDGLRPSKTEVILLDEAPAAKVTGDEVKSFENRRVIELSDSVSKMELRRQLASRTALDATGKQDGGGEEENSELLSRLPPGTILIKQRTSTRGSCAREDSDYVHESSKDSTETNSSGSSSNASYNPAGKVKRMQHRAARSKKIVEVRRNPVRNKKKKPVDEDYLRPRQRLLSAKRKAAYADPVVRKRTKTAPVPYMNTRSVTRRMYTVGATYQAPTVHDAIEWKEWPAHGMHERPVWHPQLGLAFRYNERHFVSLDNLTYREVIDEPVIEVVSVDPHSAERKHQKIISDYLSKGREEEFTKMASFEACMHGSLHSVLAYCAQVVTPSYKSGVDTKIKKICSDRCKPVRSDPTSSQSSTTSSEVTKCLVVPRRTISFTNVRNIQGNILQEVFGRASKNTLIFLKPTDPPVKQEKMGGNKVGKFDVTSGRDVEDSGSKFQDVSSGNLVLEGSGSQKCGEQSKNIEIKIPVATIVDSKEALRSLQLTNSSQASEIAKILAEYNQKAARNSRAKIPGRTKVADQSEAVQNENVTKESEVNAFVKQESSSYSPLATENDLKIKTEDPTANLDNDYRAIDLSKAKTRDSHAAEKSESHSDDSASRKWLQELIQDTAILYCAAAGVDQEDVVDYLDTLDSAQSLDWLTPR